MFQFLSFHHIANVAWRFHILFISNFIVSASCNTISFDFYAFHQICIILHKKNILVASSFFCGCFAIVQASHPFIRMGSIKHSMALFLVWIEMYRLVSLVRDRLSCATGNTSLLSRICVQNEI